MYCVGEKELYWTFYLPPFCSRLNATGKFRLGLRHENFDWLLTAKAASSTEDLAIALALVDGVEQPKPLSPTIHGV